jgi:thiol:disulfide interchange protein DsbC
MILKFLSACLCGVSLLPVTVQAQDAAKINAEIVKKAIETRFEGVKVEGVAKTPFGGLYEVRIAGGEIIYTDDKVNFLVTGSIIDAKTRENVTEERKRKLSAIKFDTLPLSLAMKQVRGNGKRIVATFEDPNCGYCKKLHQDIAGMTDVTIYTFLYPILAPDSNDKAKAIWCSTDRVRTWNDWMLNGVAPPAGKDCDTPMEKVVELGQKLRISGTPTMFFPSGERVPGAVPAARFEQLLNDSNKK